MPKKKLNLLRTPMDPPVFVEGANDCPCCQERPGDFQTKLAAADAAILELLARIDLLEEANEGAHAVIQATEGQRDRLRDLLCKLFTRTAEVTVEVASRDEDDALFVSLYGWYDFNANERYLVQRLEDGECDD